MVRRDIIFSISIPALSPQHLDQLVARAKCSLVSSESKCSIISFIENISWPNLEKSECLPCLSRRSPPLATVQKPTPPTTISNYLVVITVFIDCKLNEMRGNVYHSYQVTNPSSSLLNTPNSLIPLPKDFLWPSGSVSHLDSLVITAASSGEDHPEKTTACWKFQLSLN